MHVELVHRTFYQDRPFRAKTEEGFALDGVDLDDEGEQATADDHPDKAIGGRLSLSVANDMLCIPSVPRSAEIVS